jgi:ubiquitin-protein ligase
MSSSSAANMAVPTSSSSSSPTASTSASGIIVGTKAVNRDVKQLLKQQLFELDFPSEDNIFEIDLTIKCEGDWEGMEHTFRAKIPPNYPFSFPTITCLESERAFHPNIQPSDGSICLGILTSEEWKAMYTLTDICAAISGMFRVPNWDHALNQEAFELFHDKKDQFYRRLKALGATNPLVELVELAGTEKEEESGGGKVSAATEVTSGSKKASKKKNNKKSPAISKSAPLSQCIEGVKSVHIDESEGDAGKPTKNGSLVPSIWNQCKSQLSGTPGTKISDLSSFADQSCEAAPITETVAMVSLIILEFSNPYFYTSVMM